MGYVNTRSLLTMLTHGWRRAHILRQRSEWASTSRELGQFSAQCDDVSCFKLHTSIQPWLVQFGTNDSYTAASAINLLMFVSCELFSLLPCREEGQAPGCNPTHCLPVTAASIAKCLRALCCSLLSCQAVFPGDWLWRHFLTVSVNHLTVTTCYYSAGRARAALWYDSLSLMLHHVIYIEMAKLPRSGEVVESYNSKGTRWKPAGGKDGLWPRLRLAVAQLVLRKEMCSVSTLLLVFCHQVVHVPLALLYIDSLYTQVTCRTKLLWYRENTQRIREGSDNHLLSEK